MKNICLINYDNNYMWNCKSTILQRHNCLRYTRWANTYNAVYRICTVFFPRFFFPFFTYTCSFFPFFFIRRLSFRSRVSSRSETQAAVFVCASAIRESISGTVCGGATNEFIETHFFLFLRFSLSLSRSLLFAYSLAPSLFFSTLFLENKKNRKTKN